ncbi:hypothetical protein BDZ97DRAFT_1842175 [Flammula alnicola]|nr:hypothetical protein BDZ97DRAFT_1842175 [Flammula alnicola]
MSHEQPGQETLAVAFVVESSLAVAQEWRKKVSEYCSFILKHLNESHSGRLRMAFVTYGTADTVPSPILCKRFFTEYQVVVKEMAEDLSRLGIGMTDSGGSRGMAALEGLVASLELFDILLNQPQVKEGPNARSFVCHIIHIAASSPDASQHPSWNNSPALDDVDWESLPLEMKKRNIQFSTINLRPQLPRYPELHAASVIGGSTPWFNVRPPHALFLAAFAAPRNQKVPFAMPPKRTNESGNAERPDTKRPRLQPNTESPKPAPKAVTTTVQPVVPTPAQAGNTALVETLMQEHASKKDTQIKFAQAYHAYQTQQVMAAKQAAQAQTQAQAQANHSQIQAKIQCQRTSLISTTMPNAPNMTAPTGLQNQMQKMIEQQQQQQRLRPPHMGGGNPMPSSAPPADPARLNAVAGPSQPPQQQQALQPQPGKPPGKQTVPVWTGSLNWSGQGTAGKKDIRCYVVACSANVAECHVDTWPKAFALVPTREAEVSLPDLQLWLKRHQPALCTFQIQANVPDPKLNEYNYQILVQLLTLRKVFATAAWTTPAGGQTSNVLIFPVGRIGLAGAFFPLTGLPELPKPSNQIPPHLAAKINQINQLNQMNPEHRPAIMQLISLGDLVQRNMLSPQNHANMNAVLNMMNAQGPNGMMMGMNGPQPPIPASLPRSFVQRNADNGGMNMDLQS